MEGGGWGEGGGGGTSLGLSEMGCHIYNNYYKYTTTAKYKYLRSENPVASVCLSVCVCYTLGPISV